MKTARKLNQTKINSQMVMLARELRGISQVELAEKIGTSQVNIARWESGFIEINETAFSAIQRKLDFPEEFFKQEGEIIPPSFYRKRDKVTKKLLDACDASMNVYQLNLDKLFKSMRVENAILPNLNLNEHKTPQLAAQALRKKWKIGKGQIENVTKILESHGIVVLSIPLDTDRVDGRSMLTQYKHPVIFSNKTALGDRQRFTLAFELGHLVMHSLLPITGAEGTHEANVFAAEFLMPEKDITPDFKEGITLELLAKLKTKWKVSMQSLLFRADDLGLLTYNQKRYIIGQFNSLKIRRREPIGLDIPRETPTLMRDLISKYRIKQKMSLKEMALFFGLNEKDFLNRYEN